MKGKVREQKEKEKTNKKQKEKEKQTSLAAFIKDKTTTKKK